MQNTPRPRTEAEPLQSLVERRYRRRDVLIGALLATPTAGLLAGARRPDGLRPDPLDFEPVPASGADSLVVPSGYEAQVLLRWGDPLLPGAPAFDLGRQSGASQRAQFGFSCDFNAFLPLRPGATREGLLCTNHEFTSAREMFRGEPADEDEARRRFEVEVAAHGLSVAHVVRRADGRWALVEGSPYHRRVTGETPMTFDGPAAGCADLVTGADPSGRRPLGTVANCGGGVTPWGSVLTCEENFDDYFGRVEEVSDERLRERLARAGITPGKDLYGWYAHDRRFDLVQEPNEPNRFGWVVEVDPFDPGATPVKHTALGRFEHESASCGLADDGRVVVYMGDDARFEYLYKFVSERAFVPGDHARNRRLLERGTLYVARFSVDGTGEWLPLVPEGPLADWSMARILVHTRAAADLVGATPMDRPEDVELNPANHGVYVSLTNNSRRKEGDGGPNPRARNRHGQVLELFESGGDLSATRFSWSLFMVCGDPADAEDPFVSYGGARSADLPPVSCPDNLAVDLRGNLWVATDGQPSTLGVNDALYAVPTAGPRRGRPRRFLTGPVGCEVTGPVFTPDDDTLFLSIQHPGAGGGLEEPTSTWPHDATGVPRPSVVAVRRSEPGGSARRG